MDVEKVIKGLNHCFHGQECCGDTECPYYIEHLSDSCCLEDCQENLKIDAIALLKEQEPKQVEAEVINEIDRLYRCPSCHISMILRKQPYCHSCGQAVKWDE